MSDMLVADFLCARPDVAAAVDYERQLLDNLAMVDGIIRALGRRYRMSTDELEDLSSSARLKLIDRDYEVLRQFNGRSSLRTYLTVVITRHFLDRRIALRGRWRPCRPASRFGKLGMLLDRLLNRDGYSLDEAVQVLRTNHRVTELEPELIALSARIPRRPKRYFVAADELEGYAAPQEPLGVEGCRSSQGECDRIRTALLASLTALPSDDRLVLKLRFGQGLQVVEIARLMRLDHKPLYRRIAQLVVLLRRQLEARGVDAARVRDFLEADAAELEPLWGTNFRLSEREAGDEAAPLQPMRMAGGDI